MCLHRNRHIARYCPAAFRLNVKATEVRLQADLDRYEAADQAEAARRTASIACQADTDAFIRSWPDLSDRRALITRLK